MTGSAERYVTPKIISTSFPCRYRQKAGFAGPWEPATFTRWREPASYTPANETADLLSLNMAAPERTVSDMRDNLKTPNHSDVYIYNYIVYIIL